MNEHDLSELSYIPLYNIALNTRLSGVISLCSTNREMAKICNDDYYWKLRTEKYYPKFVEIKPKNIKWKEWYKIIDYDSYELYLNINDNLEYIIKGIHKIISNKNKIYAIDSYDNIYRLRYENDK